MATGTILQNAVSYTVIPAKAGIRAATHVAKSGCPLSQTAFAGMTLVSVRRTTLQFERPRPLAERELSAAAASRENGCIFCASVHARFASTYSKRREDVQRLLDEGVAVDIDQRWNAVIAASVALTRTPAALDRRHVEDLRRTGLDDLAIVDVIQSAAFFNWANRLMLSLGEPTAPAKG